MSLKFNRRLRLGRSLLLFSLLTSCGKPEIPKTEVNPDFEMIPPLARQVEITKLENNELGNLLVVADFGQGTLKGQYHAIQLSDGKIVMRDDGSSGDANANDGKFSVIIKEDLEALTSELELVERDKEKLMQQTVAFKGRHIVKPDISEVERFDVGAFKAGKGLLFSKNFWCHLLLNVSIPHSLLVTNLGTVENAARTVNPCGGGTPGGAWTFEKLMTDMANGTIPVDTFVRSWLDTWLNTMSVNSETIPERDNLFTMVIKPWSEKSGGTGVTINNWKTKPLSLAKAPFKLIAIVNRLDLRGNMGYGVSNAGEGRFVFEVLDPNSSTCVPLPGRFTVIFEYGIPIHNCDKLKSYGKRWYDLKNDTLGSATYNTNLQKLTDVFAGANAEPGKPNGSSLNQIRTNELALGPSWELREFNIDSATHKLVLTTVKQEPAEKYNEASSIDTPPDVARLVAWITNPTNEALILNDKHTVPLTILDTPTSTNIPFLGGKANSNNGKWTAPGVAVETRHHFSFNTCTGCHREETQTFFVHLSVVPFGTESLPSGFLAGIDAPDPIDGSVTHHFGDLALRQQKLEDLLCSSCTKGFRELIGILTFDPTRMAH